MSTLLTTLDEGGEDVNTDDMKVNAKSYHHGELRSALEHIAWQTVVADGAGKLSLRACARAANVDPAAVYRHFKSKDDILVALTQRAFNELSAAMQKDAKAEGDLTARQAVMSVGLTYVDYATSNPNVFSMMFDIAGKGAETQTVLNEGGDENAYQILQNALRTWLPDLDEQGLEVLSFTLWCNVHGLSELYIKGFGPEAEADRRARARAVCEIALDGCAAAIGGR